MREVTDEKNIFLKLNLNSISGKGNVNCLGGFPQAPGMMYRRKRGKIEKPVTNIYMYIYIYATATTVQLLFKSEYRISTSKL